MPFSTLPFADLGDIPNVFLIGAPKAGTTFLYALLAASPSIFAPREKEPNYFLHKGKKRTLHGDSKIRRDPTAYDEEAYKQVYSEWADEQYAIDASTYYLSSPNAAEHIFQARPDAKIIAVLREPIERAHSHYLMELRDGYVSESFKDALEREEYERAAPDKPWAGHYNFIRQSLYLERLKKYHELFGRRQLRIYHAEEFRHHTTAVLHDIGHFLGIEKIHDNACDEDANDFRTDRFPVATRLFNMYRNSHLRDLVNKATPRKLRDQVRMAFTKARLKQTEEKPSPCVKAVAHLEAALGDDYERTLHFARKEKILFEANSPACEAVEETVM